MQQYMIFIIILFSFQTIFAFAETESEKNLLFNTGLKLIENSKFEEAISYFDKVLEIDPNHVDALYNKGSLLYSMGKSYEAISYLAKAVDIDPNHDLAKSKLNDAVGTLTPYKKIDGMVEVTTRDSQGNLVAYYKSPHFKIIDHEFFGKKIEKVFDKEIITRNNQEVKVLQYEKVNYITENGSKGRFGLSMSGNPDLWIIFVKIPLIPITNGDAMEILFTIF